eukprot:scaffold9994_cov20-Tisochrysis_lutea.AAC.3
MQYSCRLRVEGTDVRSQQQNKCPLCLHSHVARLASKGKHVTVKQEACLLRQHAMVFVGDK